MLCRFEQTDFEASQLNDTIKQALIDSAAAGGRQAVDNADGYHGSQLGGGWATAASMLEHCAINCGEIAEPLFRKAVKQCEAHLGPDDPLTLLTVSGLANLLKAKGNVEVRLHCPLAVFFSLIHGQNRRKERQGLCVWWWGGGGGGGLPLLRLCPKTNPSLSLATRMFLPEFCLYVTLSRGLRQCTGGPWLDSKPGRGQSTL